MILLESIPNISSFTDLYSIVKLRSNILSTVSRAVQTSSMTQSTSNKELLLELLSRTKYFRLELADYRSILRGEQLCAIYEDYLPKLFELKEKLLENLGLGSVRDESSTSPQPTGSHIAQNSNQIYQSSLLSIPDFKSKLQVCAVDYISTTITIIDQCYFLFYFFVEYVATNRSVSVPSTERSTSDYACGIEYRP